MRKILFFLPLIVCFSVAGMASTTIQGNVLSLVTVNTPHHEVLRETAKPVRFPLDTVAQQTIADLKATFASLKSPYGKPAGLAAPQIGIPLRIIIVQVPPEAKQKRVAVYDTLPPTVFINPVYTPIKTKGKYKDWEGCYSVPDKMGQVKRYSAIQFSAYTEDGKKVSRVARGFLARLLQHEIDHLNGHLYVDYHCAECHFGSEQAMLKIRAKENEKNITDLMPVMLITLKEQQQFYQQELLKKHPVIVALFSPTGGQFILYRPHQKPLVASPIPNSQSYLFSSIVEHAAMNAYELSIQGMNNPVKKQTWKKDMQSFLSEINLAQKTMAQLPMSPIERQYFQRVLQKTAVFLSENISSHSLSLSRTEAYAKSIHHDFGLITKRVATAQVNHWMQTVAAWKKLLGKSWQHTYAVVMYIPVNETRNTFANILKHFMGENVTNKRLFIFTTHSYTPTAQQALEELSEKTPDRELAETVFGKSFLAYAGILPTISGQAIDAWKKHQIFEEK